MGCSPVKPNGNSDIVEDLSNHFILPTMHLFDQKYSKNSNTE